MHLHALLPQRYYTEATVFEAKNSGMPAAVRQKDNGAVSRVSPYANLYRETLWSYREIKPALLRKELD